MKLKSYIPNYILTVLLVFLITGLSASVFVSVCVLKPSYYIDSLKKHDIYKVCYDHAEDYFEKNYAVSGIPSEIYMDGIGEDIITQAVNGRAEALFDYVNGNTDKIEEPEIDFSQLEKNVSGYFEKFAEENNVEVNDLFRSQLDKTLKAAEKDISTFTNVYMSDYLEKAGIPGKLKTVSKYIDIVKYAIAGMALLCIVLMAVLNKKQIRTVFYWLGISGLCAGVIGAVPYIIVRYTGYFGRLIMRTDYIYYAVTGLLNDFVGTFMKYQIVILAASAAFMAVYIIISSIKGDKSE